ncbi:hypothetical protein [Cellulosimicrobium cellulans]|uniref:hypothetical protein n=1 Tax=Cellulosimicrobium cellulans TaxID=1710 RepID=UPI000848E916|nr:hypothetical protein [Cellulosimicrobium cellulans]
MTTTHDATAVLPAPGTGLDPARLPATDYVLVTSEADWLAVDRAGLAPVATHVRFSVTDARSDVAARLGRLVMPWRWRRTILNTGIREVRYGPGAPAAPLLGALLAGSRVVRERRGHG